jgi:hypothetical protein
MVALLPKQFHEKRVAVFRLELRENKEIERFGDSIKRRTAPAIPAQITALP